MLVLIGGYLGDQEVDGRASESFGAGIENMYKVGYGEIEDIIVQVLVKKTFLDICSPKYEHENENKP